MPEAWQVPVNPLDYQKLHEVAPALYTTPQAKAPGGIYRRPFAFLAMMDGRAYYQEEFGGPQ